MHKQKPIYMAKRTATKETLLKGSGGNYHNLHGNFLIEGKENDFQKIVVKSESVLKHEQPNGSFAEHQSLQVTKGNWVMGRQVEYNPFNQSVSRVWD